MITPSELTGVIIPTEATGAILPPELAAVIAPPELAAAVTGESGRVSRPVRVRVKVSRIARACDSRSSSPS